MFVLWNFLDLIKTTRNKKLWLIEDILCGTFFGNIICMYKSKKHGDKYT